MADNVEDPELEENAEHEVDVQVEPDASSTDSVDEKNDDNPLVNIDSSDGCKHYARKCCFISPCCGKLYTCRVCHDAEEDHEIDRYKVTDIQCMKCKIQQPVSNTCSGCSITFADFYCDVCHLFDRQREQFHCVPCGLCRVGGRENFFHCPVCDLCLALTLQNSHKCIERASRSNCPVCMEDLHTSRQANNVLPCSHIIHSICFTDMIKTGNYACPMCAKSMVSMKEVWEMMDNEVEQTEMPEEYRDMEVQILCRDCNTESRTKFHIVGLKCVICGSYNTCRAAEKEGEVVGEGGGEAEGGAGHDPPLEDLD